MKVLMIAPQPFFEPRGTPISVYQRLTALSKLGHQVDLATYHVGEEVEISGVRIFRTPRFPFIKQVKVGPSVAKLFLDLFLFGVALFLLVRNRYDAIHSHEEGSFFAMFLSWISRAPHVYDMHSSLPRQLENFGYGYLWPAVKLFEILENSVLKSADAVITIDENLADHARSICPSARVFIIENMALKADTSTEYPEVDRLENDLAASNRLVVVYTGTFERYQGLDILLSALRLALSESRNLALVLVGGKERQIQQLRAMAAELHLEDQVFFAGTVPFEEATAYLDMAQVLVSPRIGGTSVPLKIYSYLQAGKPILATRIRAHTQVLKDGTALLVEPTGEGLAQGLVRLLEDSELRQRLAVGARELARTSYDPSSYLLRISDLYDQLASPVEVANPAAQTTEN